MVRTKALALAVAAAALASALYFGFDRREINPPTHQTGAVDYDGLPIASPAPKVALDKPGALAAGLAEADRIRPVVDQKTHKGIPTLPR